MARRARAPKTRPIRVRSLIRLLAATALLIPLPAGAGVPTLSRLAVTVPGGVREYQRGELSTTLAEAAPPSVDLRSLSIDGTQATAYSARLTFADSFEQLTDFGGVPADHLVFVSLQPPNEDRLRVILNADGSGSLDRARGGRFEPVEEIEPSIEGSDVVLPIPASVGMGPDWEIQPHVLLTAHDGGGLHTHGPQVPVAALTGEGDPGTVGMPAEGAPIEDGRPSWWKLTSPMPDETRPLSLRLGEEDGGLKAFVELAAPPHPVESIDGRPVATQAIEIVLATDPLGGGTRHVIRWNALDDTAQILDTTDDATDPAPVGAASVEVRGNALVFDLGPPGTEAPPGNGGPEIPGNGAPEIPENAGPVDADAVATSGQSGCPPSVSFHVEMAIVDGDLDVRHDDGDVASGPIDEDGGAEVTSPGGRQYEFDSIIGRTLRASHTFRDCIFRVVMDLPSGALVGPKGEPGPPLPPVPEGRPAPAVGGRLFVTVDSLIIDTSGIGLGMFGPFVQVDELLPGAALTPVGKGGVSPWLIALIAAGSAGGIALSTFAFRLLGRKDPCADQRAVAEKAVAALRQVTEAYIQALEELSEASRAAEQAGLGIVGDPETGWEVPKDFQVKDGSEALARRRNQAFTAVTSAKVDFIRARGEVERALAELALCEGKAAPSTREVLGDLADRLDKAGKPEEVATKVETPVLPPGEVFDKKEKPFEGEVM